MGPIVGSVVGHVIGPIFGSISIGPSCVGHILGPVFLALLRGLVTGPAMVPCWPISCPQYKKETVISTPLHHAKPVRWNILSFRRAGVLQGSALDPIVPYACA